MPGAAEALTCAMAVSAEHRGGVRILSPSLSGPRERRCTGWAYQSLAALSFDAFGQEIIEGKTLIFCLFAHNFSQQKEHATFADSPCYARINRRLVMSIITGNI